MAKDDSYEIVDEARKYFMQIPNIVDDMDLSVFAFRLYVHFKRRTGAKDGKCNESTANLAASCHMSMGSVSKARQELIQAGLITVEITRGQHGDQYIVRIVDIWRKNMDAYAPKEQEPSPPESKPSSREGIPSLHEGKPSPGEAKNNLIKNNLIKNINLAADAAKPEPEPETQPVIVVPEDYLGKPDFPDTPAGRLRERAWTAMQAGGIEHLTMQTQVEHFFNIHPNWDSKTGRAFGEWVKSLPPDQTIRQFAEWWKAKDWRGKTGQPPTTSQIMELWPQAFIPDPAIQQHSPAEVEQMRQWMEEWQSQKQEANFV